MPLILNASTVCTPKNVWYTYSYTDDLVTLDITNQC